MSIFEIFNCFFVLLSEVHTTRLRRLKIQLCLVAGMLFFLIKRNCYAPIKFQKVFVVIKMQYIF